MLLEIGLSYCAYRKEGTGKAANPFIPRSRTALFNGILWFLCLSSFNFTAKKVFNFTGKKSRQLLRLWVISQTSFFFSPHFMVTIASPSVQMVSVTSTEERFQKCTISEESWHCILSHSCADHHYSVTVLQFQWRCFLFPSSLKMNIPELKSNLHV